MTRRYTRSKAFAPCPDCTNTNVGLVSSGTHLVWREHHRTTMTGHRIQCRASGTPTCQNPPSAGTTDATSCKHPFTQRQEATA